MSITLPTSPPTFDLTKAQKLMLLSDRLARGKHLWYKGDRDIPKLLSFKCLDQVLSDEQTVVAYPNGWFSPQRFSIDEIEIVDQAQLAKSPPSPRVLTQAELMRLPDPKPPDVPFCKGDTVKWVDCPPEFNWLQPFHIVTIDAELARLDTLTNLVPLRRLVRVEQPHRPTAPSEPAGQSVLPVVKPDPWLLPENLQEMAEVLKLCEDSEMLSDLRQSWPAYALRQASQLLDPETRRRINKWVVEQNTKSASTTAVASNNPKVDADTYSASQLTSQLSS